MTYLVRLKLYMDPTQSWRKDSLNSRWRWDAWAEEERVERPIKVCLSCMILQIMQDQSTVSPLLLLLSSIELSGTDKSLHAPLQLWYKCFDGILTRNSVKFQSQIWNYWSLECFCEYKKYKHLETSIIDDLREISGSGRLIVHRCYFPNIF